MNPSTNHELFGAIAFINRRIDLSTDEIGHYPKTSSL